MENENSHVGSILLVDDETAIIKIVKRLIESLGYRVTAHLNGEDALERFESNPDDFDLVITDIGLPDLPGDEFVKKVITIRHDIPVILCTGNSNCMSREEIVSLGIKGILEKPFKLFEMREMLQRLLPEAADAY